MSDDKAAAAYHPGDAPATRPDLDAIRSRAAESKAAHDDYMTVSPGDRRRADRDSARDVPVLLVALAAERARADQAEGERDALARVIEQAHAACTSCWGTGVVYVAPDSGEACDEAFHRVLSAAPTAEQ